MMLQKVSLVTILQKLEQILYEFQLNYTMYWANDQNGIK